MGATATTGVVSGAVTARVPNSNFSILSIIPFSLIPPLLPISVSASTVVVTSAADKNPFRRAPIPSRVSSNLVKFALEFWFLVCVLDLEFARIVSSHRRHLRLHRCRHLRRRQKLISPCADPIKGEKIKSHPRKTKLDLRSSSIQIRICGALVSVAGATIVAMYEGPSIIQIQRFHSGIRQWKLERLVLNSTDAQWLYGSILLACATLSLAVWSTIQVATMTRFPDMLLIVTNYTILGTLQTAFVHLIAERDLSAWKLDMNLKLAIIVLT
ncbi:hypothetical protein Droror1_Dr00021206 [Drosera rotundifolia]